VLAEILLASGADPNIKTRNGSRALDATRDEDLIKLLKDYGAKKGDRKTDRVPLWFRVAFELLDVFVP